MGVNFCVLTFKIKKIYIRIQKTFENKVSHTIFMIFYISIGLVQTILQFLMQGLNQDKNIFQDNKSDEKTCSNDQNSNINGYDYNLQILQISFSIWLKVIGGIIVLGMTCIFKYKYQNNFISNKKEASSFSFSQQTQPQDQITSTEINEIRIKQINTVQLIFMFIIVIESMMQSSSQQCGIILGFYLLYFLDQVSEIISSSYKRALIIIISQAYILLRRRYLFPQVIMSISIEYILISVFFFFKYTHNKQKENKRNENLARINSLKYIKQSMFIHQASLQSQNIDRSIQPRQFRQSVELQKHAFSQSDGIQSERKTNALSTQRNLKFEVQSNSIFGLQQVKASNFSKLDLIYQPTQIIQEETKQAQKTEEDEEEVINKSNETQIINHLNYMQLIYDVLFKFFPEGILFLNKDKKLIQCNESVRDIFKKTENDDILNAFFNINIKDNIDQIKTLFTAGHAHSSFVGTSNFSQTAGLGSVISTNQRNSVRQSLNTENDYSFHVTANNNSLNQPSHKIQRKSYFESINNKNSESEESKLPSFNQKNDKSLQPSYDEMNINASEFDNHNCLSQLNSQIERTRKSTLNQQFEFHLNQNQIPNLVIGQYTDILLEQIKIFSQQNPTVENIIFTEAHVLNIDLDVNAQNLGISNSNGQQQSEQKSQGSQSQLQSDLFKVYYELKFFQCLIDKDPVILVLIRDISYKKQISKLKTYANNKTQIVNFVSHELRTPLNCIIAMLDTCDIKNEKINNALLNSKQNIILNLILSLSSFNSIFINESNCLKIVIFLNQCEEGLIFTLNNFLPMIITIIYLFIIQRYLLNLSNDLLDLAQIKAGKFKINYLKINLRQILEECIYLFEYRAQQQRIILDFQFQNNVPEEIISDPHRIKQVAINLLSNAFKFTLQGTVILEVSCIQHLKRKLIQVSVHDSGVGIKKENLKFLFKAFGKEEEKRATLNSQGVGLGLLISNLIAQQLSNPRPTTEFSSINEFKRSTTQNSSNYQKQIHLYHPSVMLGIQVASEIDKGSSFTFYIDYLGYQQQNEYNINVISINQLNEVNTKTTQKTPEISYKDESIMNFDDDENFTHPSQLYTNSQYTKVNEFSRINKFQDVTLQQDIRQTLSPEQRWKSSDEDQYFVQKSKNTLRSIPNTLLAENDDFIINENQIVENKNNSLITFQYHLEKNNKPSSNVHLHNENNIEQHYIYNKTYNNISNLKITSNLHNQAKSSYLLTNMSISENELPTSSQNQIKQYHINSNTSMRKPSINYRLVHGSQNQIQFQNQVISNKAIQIISGTNSKSNHNISQNNQEENKQFQIFQKDCKCSQVLICDDNPFNLSALSTLLQKLNIKSDQVLSGLHAEQILNERCQNGKCCKTYLIIFMDIEMPHQNGFQTATNIRKHMKNKQPLIIACSSYGNQSEKTLAASYGMNNYLVKPILLGDLKQFMIEISTSYSLQQIINQQSQP